VIALFIIAFVLLAATAYTFYRRQHASSDYRAELQPRHASPRSLFDRQESHPCLDAAEASRESDERAASLLKRAGAGDFVALAEALRANDPALYARVLRELLNWAEPSETNLRSLASFVANDSDLRGSPDLAAAYTKLWQQQPVRQTTAQLLHLAALSDDADTFARAVEAACDDVRANRAGGIRPEELSALIESEYWVLSSAARSTGAGFVLKQRMSSLREQLLAESRKAESPNVES
jgi:hypothetical protein